MPRSLSRRAGTHVVGDGKLTTISEVVGFSLMAGKQRV